jgi:hypothetical protein
MQSIITQTTHTFIDDAIALAAGVKRLTVGLAADALTALARTITAPIDRLALACDVGGVIESRRIARQARAQARARQRSHRRGCFDVFGIVAAFRNLRDLT